MGRAPCSRTWLSCRPAWPCLNIDRPQLAEGPGKFSKPDKRRYYLIAVGSTTECAAILDVCLRLKLILTEPHSVGKAMLERIAAMLVKLAKAQEV